MVKFTCKVLRKNVWIKTLGDILELPRAHNKLIAILIKFCCVVLPILVTDKRLSVGAPALQQSIQG